MDIPLSEQVELIMRHWLIIFAVFASSSVYADEPYSASIALRDHRFEPAELHVPAGRHILLYLKNHDLLSEEFDSSSLKVEKVFPGNSDGIIRVSPLEPGRYEFMGEYHSDTARGVVIAE